jgi:hypothetical protein
MGYKKENLTITQYVNYTGNSGVLNAIYFDSDDSFDAGVPEYFVNEDFGAGKDVENKIVKVINSDATKSSEYKYDLTDGSTTLITAI